MTTYLAKEGDLQAAVKKVDDLDVITAKTRIIRMLSAST